MGILGAPTKFYPAYVSPGPWPSIYAKWSTTALLTDVDFYERMFVRFYHFLLLPARIRRRRARRSDLARVGEAGARGLARRRTSSSSSSPARSQRVHEYHQLPFVVIGAIYFGVVAWPLFDGGLDPIAVRDPPCGDPASKPRWSSRSDSWRFYCSSVTQAYFAPRGMAETHAAGRRRHRSGHDRQRPGDRRRRLRDHVAHPAVFHAPERLDFDVGDLTPQVVDNLRTPRRAVLRDDAVVPLQADAGRRPPPILERYRPVNVRRGPGRYE